MLPGLLKATGGSIADRYLQDVNIHTWLEVTKVCSLMPRLLWKTVRWQSCMHYSPVMYMSGVLDHWSELD